MLFPSFYLAPISYYARLAQADEVVIDAEDIYRKQTLRNRCWIASPNGALALTIPVVKFVPYRTPMRDIRISDHGNWRHLHWNALQSSYRRTPFFEFYADDFAPFYERRWEFLIDYNQAMQDMVWEELGGREQEVGDRRRVLERQNKWQEDKESSNLQPLTSHLLPPYYQLFSDRNGFLPDLSIVDLLFNMGPESILYLNSIDTIGAIDKTIEK